MPTRCHLAFFPASLGQGISTGALHTSLREPLEIVVVIEVHHDSASPATQVVGRRGRRTCGVGVLRQGRWRRRAGGRPVDAPVLTVSHRARSAAVARAG